MPIFETPQLTQVVSSLVLTGAFLVAALWGLVAPRNGFLKLLIVAGGLCGAVGTGVTTLAAAQLRWTSSTTVARWQLDHDWVRTGGAVAAAAGVVLIVLSLIVASAGRRRAAAVVDPAAVPPGPVTGGAPGR